MNTVRSFFEDSDWVLEQKTDGDNFWRKKMRTGDRRVTFRHNVQVREFQRYNHRNQHTYRNYRNVDEDDYEDSREYLDVLVDESQYETKNHASIMRMQLIGAGVILSVLLSTLVPVYLLRLGG